MLTPDEYCGVFPPPPGQTADCVNPDTHQPENIAYLTIMLVLVAPCVGIRIYTRAYISRQVGLDDYLCIVAFCLIILYSVFLILAGKHYMGHHSWEITLDQLITGYRYFQLSQWTYVLICPTVKISCLWFHRRIFGPHPKLRYLCYGGIAFVLVAYTAFLVISIIACLPIEYAWDPTIHPRCISSESITFFGGTINVATDIFVVLLPIPAIWNLNMSPQRKLRYLSIFSLGFIVCALSITRFASSPKLFNSNDSTWHIFFFTVISTLEVDIGMMCTCFLAFPSFLDHHGPQILKHWRSYTSFTRSSSGQRGHEAKQASDKDTTSSSMDSRRENRHWDEVEATAEEEGRVKTPPSPHFSLDEAWLKGKTEEPIALYSIGWSPNQVTKSQCPAGE